MQAGIDMMGVVTNVGQLGSVKRKSDSSELSRRDVTLLDQRCGSRTFPFLPFPLPFPVFSFFPCPFPVFSFFPCPFPVFSFFPCCPCMCFRSSVVNVNERAESGNVQALYKTHQGNALSKKFPRNSLCKHECEERW